MAEIPDVFEELKSFGHFSNLGHAIDVVDRARRLPIEQRTDVASILISVGDIVNPTTENRAELLSRVHTSIDSLVKEEDENIAELFYIMSSIISTEPAGASVLKVIHRP